MPKQAAVTSEQFKAWRRSTGLSVIEAAAALDLSTEAIKSYANGRRPVSGTVALAMSAVSAGLRPWAPPHNRTGDGVTTPDCDLEM